MIKRVLYFGSPVYLRLENKQINACFPDKNIQVENFPIEDIGVIVIDNMQITLSHNLLNELLENNVSVITCSANHHPSGLFLPIESNSIQSELFKAQINSSVPLKKQLWQQTIIAKIRNQASVLYALKKKNENMLKWSRDVKSGDPSNVEAKASAFYWKNIFPPELNFIRDRFGSPPNNLLNYGYAILRAIIARSLTISGLLPTLGIHHKNKYNAFCLADDIMEPYRPYVDKIVVDIIYNGEDYECLNKSIKEQLLIIPLIDVQLEQKRKPLTIAAQSTAASLAKCFEKVERKIKYPQLFYDI